MMGAGRQEATLFGQLRRDLIERRIASGVECLEAHLPLLESLDPRMPDAGQLLGLVAQWVDAGFRDAQLVRGILARFDKQSRAHLRVLDYLHVRMADGLLAMSDQEPEAAIRHFQVVDSLDSATGDAHLATISKFWIGRCLRQEGRYADALSYVISARDMALAAGFSKVAAVIQVLESWLAFQQNRLKDAAAILQQAEAVLQDTDDFVALGNIQSAYGRIARREGRHERGVEHFERAIEFYKKRDENHRNMARSLANMALVKRQLAAHVHKSLDRAATRRKSGDAAAESPDRRDRQRIEKLRAEARDELEQAWAIYAFHQTHHGMGVVYINRGLLALDDGSLDEAGADGQSAFEQGAQKRDYILMARARILQSLVEDGKYEEQIEEHADPNRNAQLALEYANEAVEYARETQNSRLLARAFIRQGLSYANEPFENQDAARQCCNSAMTLIPPNQYDSLWEELQELRTRVVRGGRVDTVLQEWSQGLVGTSTFQQITEEFARLLIPRVWEREGRRVSRVAEKLSMSPKKVRRILRAAGLLGPGETKNGELHQ